MRRHVDEVVRHLNGSVERRIYDVYDGGPETLKLMEGHERIFRAHLEANGLDADRFLLEPWRKALREYVADIRAERS